MVSEVVKYYQAGGQRIALRKNGAVSYLFGDHLGSTALTASETGGRMSEIRYKPWGESRYTFGATPTQKFVAGKAGRIFATNCTNCHEGRSSIRVN